MAASDNVAMEPWVYRPATFADSWMSEAFARDTNKALTLALQKSLSSNNNNNNNNNRNSESGDSEFLRFLNTFQPETTPTPETVSGSDPETVVAAAEVGTKRQRNTVIPVAGGKVAKRKSRASKRTQTTFIAADPANFREMVQQVTGMKFSNNNMSSSVVKPEPQRLGGARNINGGGMPTLDTSSFLLDQQQQMMGVGPASMCYGGGARRIEVAEGGGGGVSGGGFGSFDSFSSFPTLESWKVM